MGNNVYILSIKRTAIGSFLGSLSEMGPVELGTQLLNIMLEGYPQVQDEVDEVIIGHVLSGGQKQNVARQISVLAGLSEDVPAYAINMLCGSGLKAIYEAYTHIKAGEADCIIAGGVESMTNAKFTIADNLRQGKKMGSFTVEDSMLTDGLTDAFTGVHMGITAENLAETYHLTREAQDQFALDSQQKAARSQVEGKFRDEIIPITVKTRRAEYIFSEDEYIRKDVTIEKLSGLRPAFDKDGTVTAGNASGINDGAAFAFVVSEKFVQEHNLEPLVKIISFGQSGVDPQMMGIGPVKAISASLSKAQLSLKDMDVIELNEAFAAQSLAVMTQLSDDFDYPLDDMAQKVNVNGGAIALGHPIGASGARVSATLIHEMIRQGAKLGLAALCIGGGMGISMVVENCQKS